MVMKQQVEDSASRRSAAIRCDLGRLRRIILLERHVRWPGSLSFPRTYQYHRQKLSSQD